MSRRNVIRIPATRLLVIAIATWCPGALAIDPVALTAVLENAHTEMKLPGVRAAVRLADGRIVRAAVGLADKKTGLPLDNEMGMPGGSTGKTFVAALTMLLVEDGTLALDDPVAKWLGDESWFKRMPNRGEVRIHHLLSHSSGISDYPGTIRFNMMMAARVVRHGSAKFEPEELIDIAIRRKAHFPAGKGFRYSDCGYLVLGRVIEAATGRQYYELLQERILVPQQLDEVRLQDQSVLTGVATGYQAGQPSIKKDGRMKLDPSSEWTGGGLVTNPTMLVQFYAALADGRVVTPASFALMRESGWRDPQQPDWHYGFGMFVHGNSLSHGGLWPGYRTRVSHDLETGTTVAVQTNRDGRIDMMELARRVYELVPSGVTSPVFH